ncbi:MAG: hypothetical protein WEB52_16275 [Dehalococcoidia bacterium]
MLAASSILLGAFAFACDDDDDTDLIEEVQTEVGEAATAITGEVTEITADDDETPGAGGSEGTEEPDNCATPEAAETPDPEATVPAGCPTPDPVSTP